MNVQVKSGSCHTLILLILSAVAVPVQAAQTRCAQSEIIVISEKTSDCEKACSAVRSGVEILKSIGLDTPEPLKITLVKKISERDYDSIIGYFDLRSNEIHLLDLDSAMNGAGRVPTSFGFKTTPAIWSSYIVHELAHAAARNRFVPGVPVHTASEYIASVAQIASLPAAERENVINKYSEMSGFEKTEEIVFAYYLLDPGKFSIKAYLHFSRPENGRIFILRLLQEGLPDD